MPNTCENCAHWRPVEARQDVRAGAVGECRYGPPAASYQWPKTRPDGYCGCHSVVKAETAKRKAEPRNLKLEVRNPEAIA